MSCAQRAGAGCVERGRSTRTPRVFARAPRGGAEARARRRSWVATAAPPRALEWRSRGGEHVPFASPPLFRGAIMARWRPASPSTTRRREHASAGLACCSIPLTSSQWRNGGRIMAAWAVGPGPGPALALLRSSSPIRLQQACVRPWPVTGRRGAAPAIGNAYYFYF